MLGQPAKGISGDLASPAEPVLVRRARVLAVRIAAGLLSRLLGTADGRTVVTMAARELSLILRSRDWHRHLGTWTAFNASLIALPMLYRAGAERWLFPSSTGWFLLCGYSLQVGVALFMVQWTVRRLRHDTYSNRLDELVLTRCSAADIAMGEACASAVASLWLVAASMPACVLIAAIGGREASAALLLALSLIPAGSLGVWFGMGWGLAFTFRRPGAALSPITDWWTKGPVLGPIWIAWCALMFFTLAWAMLGLVPGGSALVGRVAGWAMQIAQYAFWHLNPVLTVGGAAGAWPTTWLTDWLAALAFAAFMMRKSMDSVQLAIGELPQREQRKDDEVYWIHHHLHPFMQFGEARRPVPQYRDGGDVIAAFDTALGHRVYLHPFLWSLAIMAYLFLLGWSMLVPHLGRGTGIAAVLVPATGALLLMSGGVAVSFGWERDQGRWPALAVLPISNVWLAAGKIKGVVRPTLWIGLVAGMTALLLGWRGAIEVEASLWMALHVIAFPVALACVTATLALSTPTVGEALYRWAVLGAIPTVAWLLPPPIGGDDGLALPFSPPLLVLLLVAKGPNPALLQGAWVSFALEVIGVVSAFVIFHLYLREWTVGERD
jgi:hypothetical protein